jgi:uncharacterized membrane protein YukC
LKQSNKQRSAEKKAKQAAIAAQPTHDITKYVLIGSIMVVMLVFFI